MRCLPHGTRRMVGSCVSGRRVPVPTSLNGLVWLPSSCPLRHQRGQLAWIKRALFWTGFSLGLARQGIACSLHYPFSRSRCGVLAEWLEYLANSLPEPSSLSTCFTA